MEHWGRDTEGTKLTIYHWNLSFYDAIFVIIGVTSDDKVGTLWQRHTGNQTGYLSLKFESFYDANLVITGSASDDNVGIITTLGVSQ